MSDPTLSTEQRDALAEFRSLGAAIHLFRCSNPDCRHYDDESYFTPRDNDAASAVLASDWLSDLIAEAEQRGYTEGYEKGLRDPGSEWMTAARREVTAAVESVLTDPAVRLDDITEAGAEAVRAALADPAAHVAAIKAEALREAADDFDSPTSPLHIMGAAQALRDHADRIGGAR